MLDLLVIGAGLSGFSAALVAAKAGLSAKIIAKGLGSIHWSAATIDVLGYLPGRGDTAVLNPELAIRELPNSHPYRLIPDGLQDAALVDFQELVSKAGLPYVAAQTPGDNLMLPSAVGAARPTFLAPFAQVGGDLTNDEPILVVGFDGMRDFYPTLIAENLRAQGHDARAEFLPLEVLTGRRDSNAVQLAQAVDAVTVQNRLGIALAKLVRPGERIGLPAILGLFRHADVVSLLKKRTEATVFEIPTLPPSVPGIRLHHLLRTHLLQHGVRVEAGMEAINYEADGRRVHWVETETSARPHKHHAESYLLATGGVLGGGFNSDPDGHFWEVVFDLPLTVPQDRRAWFRPEFLDPSGQPVFHGGVSVNENLQPVNGDGEPVFENVWAAGGLLAHADPIQERSLEGIAITTGAVAAHRIVERQ